MEKSIKKLIKEFCPSGVEYKKIKDIAEVGTGSSDRKDAIIDGEYPFYVRSKDILRKDSFEFDEEAVIIPGEGGVGEIFHYVNGKYALHQRAYRIVLKDNKIKTKFLFYYMSNGFKKFILSKALSSTVTSIRKPMIEEFEIPLPPLPIQNAIVEILDKFAGLSKEIELRKKQYEYYRNLLLCEYLPRNSC